MCAMTSGALGLLHGYVLVLEPHLSEHHCRGRQFHPAAGSSLPSAVAHALAQTSTDSQHSFLLLQMQCGSTCCVSTGAITLWQPFLLCRYKTGALQRHAGASLCYANDFHKGGGGGGGKGGGCLLSRRPGVLLMGTITLREAVPGSCSAHDIAL